MRMGLLRNTDPDFSTRQEKPGFSSSSAGGNIKDQMKKEMNRRNVKEPSGVRDFKKRGKNSTS